MVQIIRYSCCNKVFAACLEPDCYQDSDWLMNIRRYSLRGDKIEMVESGTWKFERCTCKKEKEDQKQIKLF